MDSQIGEDQHHFELCDFVRRKLIHRLHRRIDYTWSLWATSFEATQFVVDKRTVHLLFKANVIKIDASTWFGKVKNGDSCGSYLWLHKHYIGDIHDMRSAASATSKLENLFWKLEAGFGLEKFLTQINETMKEVRRWTTSFSNGKFSWADNVQIRAIMESSEINVSWILKVIAWRFHKQFQYNVSKWSREESREVLVPHLWIEYQAMDVVVILMWANLHLWGLHLVTHDWFPWKQNQTTKSWWLIMFYLELQLYQYAADDAMKNNVVIVNWREWTWNRDTRIQECYNTTRTTEI